METIKKYRSYEKRRKKNKTGAEKEYVVNKDIYPKNSLTSNIISEDVLPKGTVLSVKPVPEGSVAKSVFEIRSFFIKIHCF